MPWLYHSCPYCHGDMFQDYDQTWKCLQCVRQYVIERLILTPVRRKAIGLYATVRKRVP